MYREKIYGYNAPKRCVAKLYLKYKDKPFNVKIKSVYINNNYELYSIQGLLGKY